MRLTAAVAAALLALPAAAPAQTGPTEVAEAAFARVGCAVPRDRFEDFLALVAHDGLAADGVGADPQLMRRAVDDMRSADVDFITIGQYLQPTPKHHAVANFVTPEEFGGYEKAAWGKGFLMVSATPLTRSSYHAGDDFARLRAERQRRLSAG